MSLNMTRYYNIVVILVQEWCVMSWCVRHCWKLKVHLSMTFLFDRIYNNRYKCIPDLNEIQLARPLLSVIYKALIIETKPETNLYRLRYKSHIVKADDYAFTTWLLIINDDWLMMIIKTKKFILNWKQSIMKKNFEFNHVTYIK